MNLPKSGIDFLSYACHHVNNIRWRPKSQQSNIHTTNVIGSDYCSPKNGRHRQEFYSLFLFYSTPSICSGGACALRGSASIWTHSGWKRSRDRCSILGGLPICQFFWGLLWWLWGSYSHNSQFLLFLNNHVPRILFASAKTQFAWGNLGMCGSGIWPQSRYPSHSMRYGPNNRIPAVWTDDGWASGGFQAWRQNSE